MEEDAAVPILAALAQGSRLRTVALLSKAGRSGMPASEIADAVGIPRNLMSAHLAVLGRAGLVEGRREGRRVTYSLRASTVDAIATYLAELPGDPSSRAHDA